MFARQSTLILVHVECARPVCVLLGQCRFPSRWIVVRRTVVVDGGCGVVCRCVILLLIATIKQNVHFLGGFRVRTLRRAVRGVIVVVAAVCRTAVGVAVVHGQLLLLLVNVLHGVPNGQPRSLSRTVLFLLKPSHGRIHSFSAHNQSIDG